MQPAITIIVPVYNTEKYLRECLESLVHQSFQNIEILLINDGSTDKSQNIIDEYSEKYTFVTGITKENGGSSSARNLGLQHAKGEFVIFIDSDDYVDERYAETLYRTAVRQCSDMVICDFVRVTDDGKVTRDYKLDLGKEKIRILTFLSCNRIIRRSLFENFDIRYCEGISCEDIPVILQLEAVARNVKILPYAGYYYRMNPESATSGFKKRGIRKEKIPFDALDQCIQFCLKNGKNFTKPQLEFYICRIVTSLIFEVAKGGERDVIIYMCRRLRKMFECYFPDYYKNQYIKLTAVPHIPFSQRAGTWLCIHLMRRKCLEPFACLYAGISK